MKNITLLTLFLACSEHGYAEWINKTVNPFTDSIKKIEKKKDSIKITKSAPKTRKHVIGNLPNSYNKLKGVVYTLSPTIVSDTIKVNHKLIPSTKLKVLVDDSIVAVENTSVPVVALIQSGDYYGSSLVGSSEYNPVSKKITVRFYSLYTVDNAEFTLDSSFIVEGSTFLKPSKIYSRKKSNIFKFGTMSFLSSLIDSRVRRVNTLFGESMGRDLESSTYKGLSDTAEGLSNLSRLNISKEKDVATINGPILGEVKIHTKLVSRLKKGELK